MSGAKAYMATDHEFGDVIPTPDRHSLNPEEGGGENWEVVRWDFHERGVQLLWECELTRSLQTVRPPSKFHPHAGKPKPKPAAKKPAPAAAKAAPAPRPAPVAAKPAPAGPRPKKPKRAPESPAAEATP